MTMVYMLPVLYTVLTVWPMRSHWFLHGATVLPASAMLLVDASGQYSWLMATSGHCVLDARLSSVTACWLMAIWMNVAHAVAAHWPHGHGHGSGSHM